MSSQNYVCESKLTISDLWILNGHMRIIASPSSKRGRSRPLGLNEEQRSAQRRGGRTYERSAGAVIFYRQGKDILFLLTRYKSKVGGHWEFARGHIEPGEHEKDTARREIAEETGLAGVKFLPGFRKLTRFHFRDQNTIVTKDAIFYLVQSKTLHIEISEENLGYVWLLYPLAREHIKFEAAKKVLDEAWAFLQPGASKKV